MAGLEEPQTGCVSAERGWFWVQHQAESGWGPCSRQEFTSGVVRQLQTTAFSRCRLWIPGIDTFSPQGAANWLRFPNKPPFTPETPVTAVNFIAYLRVSTDRQGASGLGIEAQRDAVMRHVASVGGFLLAEHVEVVREALITTMLVRDQPNSRSLVSLGSRFIKAMLFAVLVIARLDRLARSVSFISSLIEGSVEFVACDMPAANKMVLQMLAVFAEFERDQIAARTKAALAAARARGVILGANGRKLAGENMAAANDFAEGLRGAVKAALAAGSHTLREISDQLNESGLRTREGARWSPSSAHRLLRRLHLATPAMPGPLRGQAFSLEWSGSHGQGARAV